MTEYYKWKLKDLKNEEERLLGENVLNMKQAIDLLEIKNGIKKELNTVIVTSGACYFGASNDISIEFNGEIYQITNGGNMQQLLKDFEIFKVIEKVSLIPQIKMNLLGTTRLSKYEIQTYSALQKEITIQIQNLRLQNKIVKKIVIDDNREQYGLYLKTIYDEGIITSSQYIDWLNAVENRANLINKTWLELGKNLGVEVVFEHILSPEKSTKNGYDETSWDNFKKLLLDKKTTPQKILDLLPANKLRQDFLRERSSFDKKGNVLSKITFESITHSSFAAKHLRTNYDVYRIQTFHETPQEYAINQSILNYGKAINGAKITHNYITTDEECKLRKLKNDALILQTNIENLKIQMRKYNKFKKTLQTDKKELQKLNEELRISKNKLKSITQEKKEIDGKKYKSKGTIVSLNSYFDSEPITKLNEFEKKFVNIVRKNNKIHQKVLILERKKDETQ